MADYRRMFQEGTQFVGSLVLTILAVMAIAGTTVVLVAHTLMYLGVGALGAWYFSIPIGTFLSMPIWMTAFLYIVDKTSPMIA